MCRGYNLQINVAIIGAGLGITHITYVDAVVMLEAGLGTAVVLRGDIEALLLGG